MEDSQIRVFSIGNNEECQYIRDLGFTKAKLCGEFCTGFKLALGFGYLEELSLRQNSAYSNWIFFEPQYCLLSLQHFSADSSELSEVIQKIQARTSTQEEIVRLARGSSAFAHQVIDFANKVFDIPDTCDCINDILNATSFQKSLETLNVQINIFTYQTCLGSLKANQYIYPIVLNLLIPDELSKVYNLYHQMYKVMSTEHLNTSEEFIETYQSPDSLEKIAEILLRKLPKLSEADNDSVRQLINQVKSSNLAGFSYESLISN